MYTYILEIQNGQGDTVNFLPFYGSLDAADIFGEENTPAGHSFRAERIWHIDGNSYEGQICQYAGHGNIYAIENGVVSIIGTIEN